MHISRSTVNDEATKVVLERIYAAITEQHVNGHVVDTLVFHPDDIDRGIGTLRGIRVLTRPDVSRSHMELKAGGRHIADVDLAA